MVNNYAQNINRLSELGAYPILIIKANIHKVLNHECFSTINLIGAFHQISVLEKKKAKDCFSSLWKLIPVSAHPFY